MKLRLSADGWAALLDSIGGAPSSWTLDVGKTAFGFTWELALRTKGVDVQLEDLEIDPATRLLTYKGQQILIYIRDTHQEADVLLHQRKEARRFHYMDCRTIVNMRLRDRFARYVAIARRDGMFPVNSREEDGSSISLEAPLGVCKNCLKELDYDNYATESRSQQEDIWDYFSIEAFFEEYSSRISIVPADACISPRTDQYAANWNEVSMWFRERHRWRCSACGVVCTAFRRVLHVHHRNHDKSNNGEQNLVALCVLCHGKEDGHLTMYISPEHREIVMRLRREQGIIR